MCTCLKVGFYSTKHRITRSLDSSRHVEILRNNTTFFKYMFQQIQSVIFSPLFLYLISILRTLYMFNSVLSVIQTEDDRGSVETCI